MFITTIFYLLIIHKLFRAGLKINIPVESHEHFPGEPSYKASSQHFKKLVDGVHMMEAISSSADTQSWLALS
jgi:hypothetical protein